MDDMAGLFQLEEVLMPKIRTSTIENELEIYITTPSKVVKFYPKE